VIVNCTKYANSVNTELNTRETNVMFRKSCNGWERWRRFVNLFEFTQHSPNSAFPIYRTLGTLLPPPLPCGTYSLCARSCRCWCLATRSMWCHISEVDNRKTLSYACLAVCIWLKLSAMFNNQHTLLSRVTSVGCPESLHIINKADGKPAITTKLSGLECCYVHLRASRFPTGLSIFSLFLCQHYWWHHL
jgi:hypothetical protein